MFVKTVRKLQRSLLLAAGSLFVVLGFLGIIVPVLPTTPFLLLSAACFARSSDRFYQWLLNNRYLGGYIRNYREHKGIPLRSKILTLIFLWSTIAYSALLVVDILWMRILLLVVATGVTVHIVTFPTLKH